MSLTTKQEITDEEYEEFIMDLQKLQVKLKKFRMNNTARKLKLFLSSVSLKRGSR